MTSGVTLNAQIVTRDTVTPLYINVTVSRYVERDKTRKIVSRIEIVSSGASALTWSRAALTRIPVGGVTSYPSVTCPSGVNASGTSRTGQRRAMA